MHRSGECSVLVHEAACAVLYLAFHRDIFAAPADVFRFEAVELRNGYLTGRLWFLGVTLCLWISKLDPCADRGLPLIC